MQESEPDGRLTQLTLIHTEVEAHLQAFANRKQAFDTRTGVLVAASGLVVSFGGTLTASPFSVISVVFALVATLLGAAALMPRMTLSLDPEKIRQKVYGLSEAEAKLWLIDHKIELLSTSERTNKFRGRALRAGLISFAIAVTLIAVATFTMI